LALSSLLDEFLSSVILRFLSGASGISSGIGVLLGLLLVLALLHVNSTGGLSA